MFCHKCGIKMADDAVFCHKCGASVHNETEDAQVDSAVQTDDVPVPNKPAETTDAETKTEDEAKFDVVFKGLDTAVVTSEVLTEEPSETSNIIASSSRSNKPQDSGSSDRSCSKCGHERILDSGWCPICNHKGDPIRQSLSASVDAHPAIKQVADGCHVYLDKFIARESAFSTASAFVKLYKPREIYVIKAVYAGLVILYVAFFVYGLYLTFVRDESGVSSWVVFVALVAAGYCVSIWIKYVKVKSKSGESHGLPQEIQDITTLKNFLEKALSGYGFTKWYKSFSGHSRQITFSFRELPFTVIFNESMTAYSVSASNAIGNDKKNKVSQTYLYESILVAMPVLRGAIEYYSRMQDESWKV